MSANSCDVLIVTVTDVEGEAILAAFRSATGEKPRPFAVGARQYFHLGSIHGAAVAMTRCQIGSSGPAASQRAIQESIEAFKPGAVIMAGIAFGISADRQAIGDVLVAENLRPYCSTLVRSGKSCGHPDRTCHRRC